MFYIFIAALSGVSTVISRIINANLSTKIGMYQSTFYNFLTGLLFSILTLLFSKESFSDCLPILTDIPITAYLGGLVGVASISISNFVAPKISAFYMALLIFVGQLFVGIIIDYFTLDILSIGKVVGGIIVVIGLSYNLMLDKKSSTN